MTTYSLFVTCPRGLESVLHAELAAQGCTGFAPTDGGIACTGGLEQVYRGGSSLGNTWRSSAASCCA